MIPAFSHACVALANSAHPSHTRACSRRHVLTTLLTLPALSVSEPLLAESALSELVEHNHVLRLLRTNCSPFINSLSLHVPHPQRPHLLLWRGSQNSSPPSFRRCAPVPDLLDPHTYGEQGVAFFEYLEQYIKHNVPPSHQVLPGSAHIATGNRSVACHWGKPVTVWPIGEFNYAYWQNSPLLYTRGQTIHQTFSKGKQLIVGRHLREAITAGKEVMFDAPAFFELREDIAGQIIASLMP